jgi:CopA family copper-resistance protein
MTFFDIRIPGLEMTVVAADGQNIQPVPVDEFRIGTAETYDVIVTPDTHQAFTVFAQSSDRSGYARGTLTPEPGLAAPVPELDATPVLTHRDMGMGHSGMSADASDPGAMAGHGAGHTGTDHSTMQHGEQSLAPAGQGNHQPGQPVIRHHETESGPGVAMLAEMPANGLTDPGLGLRDHEQVHGRRVLTYADLRGLTPTHDTREPGREIQLHLTGNMKRYMWSINGIPFVEAEPLHFDAGERLRIVLVNDTMMAHPIHLHGMWSELETGDPDHIPRKHTVIAQPGSTVSYLVTADAPGSWAFHCHLLYHMHGMMREVHVGAVTPSDHAHAPSI